MASLPIDTAFRAPRVTATPVKHNYVGADYRAGTILKIMGKEGWYSSSAASAIGPFATRALAEDAEYFDRHYG